MNKTRLYKTLATLTILATLATTFLMPSHANAASYINKQTSLAGKEVSISYDGFGGYFVESLEDSVPYQTSLLKIATASSNEVLSKTKTVKYYNSNNVLLWFYSLTASFNVNRGVSSTYKSSSAKATISNTAWSVADENHSGSGTKASGTIKMMKNNITVSKTINITCDKYGNFK